jgi:predicted metal-dependent enzyme (double-stranded beta helix superfamily)
VSGVTASTFVDLNCGLGRLTVLTRCVAAEVLAGLHEVPIDPQRRRYRRLHIDDAFDVWLIGWATGQATELHDHGDSLGALTVVSGSLSERRWAPHRGGIRVRALRAGRSQGFRIGHVHDVVNLSSMSAVSVHAYSPPLTAMSYYEFDAAAAALRRVRTTPYAMPG